MNPERQMRLFRNGRNQALRIPRDLELPGRVATERIYATIRVTLERKGTPIGAHDMLIAAHARAIEAVCVTDNVAEFKRVPALRVENWLRS